jgi:hypothetical protein
MATQAEVRRIVLSQPETEEAPDHSAFSVRNRGVGRAKRFADGRYDDIGGGTPPETLVDQVARGRA